tara:strand:+ start:79 stop:336 length:258 start_codon:yes stop_codon:yes gene_type:complete
MNNKRPSTPMPKKLPPLKTKFKGSSLELNNLTKISEPIIFRNENGNRLSLELEKKEYYSYNEVIELLERLDHLWENDKKNYDYYA